ncbi:hypothetical protein DK26_19480 [Bosea sp. WAO]|uniref:hypothetical protein n=1 Tax=Bosea sp. WAO TaxID=406341 RepID=UPI00074AD668|nr:hypothetical protein [Bosea sp. WAO]KUL93930.1 hypothetical protein DK26_19480 [Bosea sp. WAO]
MQIIDFVPLPDPGGSTARTVARFSLSFPDMKLSGFRLRLRPNGTFIVAAPATDGMRVANFKPDLFRQINSAAEAAYRGLYASDRNCA